MRGANQKHNSKDFKKNKDHNTPICVYQKLGGENELDDMEKYDDIV